MPRIDPQQLLVCLTPLLASNGGIKSTQEVLRLASLMEKYSKKLVSKCIYIQILKCTETELIGQFMSMGGWNLTHNWLRDGAESSNWAFVQELLEMLLLCPVDGNRLKSNHTPKIVKNLSISCPHNSVRILSTRLVEQWLKIAHQEKQQLQGNGLPNGINGTAANHNNSNIILNNKLSVDDSSSVQNPHNNDDILNDSVTESSAPSVAKKNGLVSELNDDAFSKKSASENVKYKINKENSGGLLLTIKRSTSVEDKDLKIIKSSEHKSKSISTEKEKDATKKSSSSSSHKSSSSSSSKSSHRNKDRSSSRHRSSGKSSSSNSSSSSKDKHRSSSSSSSRDKDKDREKRKKDAEKSSQAEKDKETLNFLAPLPSTKLPKITKRQQSENGENKSSESNKDLSETSQIIKKPSEPVEKKKPSISIEVRKGDKPKTVKTINSQFRNHGLAEEPPPPPSRKDLKKPSQVPTCLPTSLPSSGALKVSTSPPPSKKIHLEKLLDSESSQTSERVGGVKLIKPKPMLVESSGFLEALSASTIVAKKDVKKRKRLTSNSTSGKKDDLESSKIDAKPLKFYKDTLEETEDEVNGEKSPTKELDNAADDKKENGEKLPDQSKCESENPKSPDANNKTDLVELEEPEEKRPPGQGCGPDGPPGVLVDPTCPRRKRVKRTIRWKTEEHLTEIRYFELDETERVNVSKPFSEQQLMERCEERSAFMLGRKFRSDDITTMAEQTLWRPLIIVDNVPHIDYGSKSREAQIQAEREKTVLQELYLSRTSLIDSPHEPDTEHYDFIEPAIIPLDDLTGNPDAINNFKDIAWPTPKGESAAPFMSNAFANVFPNVNVGPPAGFPTNPIVANPLANFSLGIASPPIQVPNMLNQWAIPPAFIQQLPTTVPPPPLQNNFNRNVMGNNYRSNTYNRGFNTSNNNNNNSGGNWVRGNARRGICNQFQRTGFCRNGANCVYIHER